MASETTFDHWKVVFSILSSWILNLALHIIICQFQKKSTVTYLMSLTPCSCHQCGYIPGMQKLKFTLYFLLIIIMLRQIYLIGCIWCSPQSATIHNQILLTTFSFRPSLLKFSFNFSNRLYVQLWFAPTFLCAGYLVTDSRTAKL